MPRSNYQKLTDIAGDLREMIPSLSRDAAEHLEKAIKIAEELAMEELLAIYNNSPVHPTLPTEEGR